MEKALKKIMLILCALMVLAMCGCAEMETSENDGRITIIYYNTSVAIYRDNLTGVQYIGKTGGGGICVMVNADGTPYTGG